MSDPSERYFPSEPPDWDFVRNEFPSPLAITCTRLLSEMDRQESIAAAWALRDAFECLFKFSASLAVADFLHAGPDPVAAGKIAELLLKPSGLSLGEWHTLLEMALDPLKPLAREGRLNESNRILPELFGTFFEIKGRLRRSPLNDRISGGQGDNFAAWRSRVFGHGVFSQDRSYYAEETLTWLPTLGDFYAALRPVLAGRQLVSRTPDGDEVVWQGAGYLPPVSRHEHEPWGDPLPMFLAPAPGSDFSSLPLVPFLSMRQCQSCRQPAVFFFDKNQYDRNRDRHSTTFLEYFNGHPGTHKNWLETRRLAGFVPPTVKWERGSYDGEEVDGSQGIVFRDFDAEYLRPDYMLDAVWRITEEQPKGYIHVIGPGGMGKTYFVRGLADEGKEQGAVVLPYYILPGARTDAQTFVSELHAYAYDTLQFRTLQPQVRGINTAAEMQAEFVSYLSELKRTNRIDLLIVTIDALDELSDPGDHSIGITDCLPPPGLLPDGCFFVLTSREELRPKVQADVLRLQAALPVGYTYLTLGYSDAANQNLLRTYLAKNLPLPLRTPESIDAVLARCGGIFLYAFHLCRALEAGVFPDITALPDGAEFYPAYLDRLRTCVGDHLYETVYLPTLLLLCAAQQPVTIDQLARWGVPRDRLKLALLDLRDFLCVLRELPWQDRLSEPDSENVYVMAHEAFIRYVMENITLLILYRKLHARIARTIHAAYSHWKDIDPLDSSNLYDLLFFPIHLQKARLNADEMSLRSNRGFASTCWKAGLVAGKQGRHRLGTDLFQRSVSVYRRISSQKPEDDVVKGLLAGVLMNKANDMSVLETLPSALECYQEGIVLMRTLVASGHTDVVAPLVSALRGRADTLSKLGRSKDALNLVGCHSPKLASLPYLV